MSLKEREKGPRLALCVAMKGIVAALIILVAQVASFAPVKHARLPKGGTVPKSVSADLGLICIDEYVPQHEATPFLFAQRTHLIQRSL